MQIDPATQKLIRDTYSELAPELRTAYVHAQAEKYEHENTLTIRNIVAGDNPEGWYKKPIVGARAYPDPKPYRKPRRKDLPQKPKYNQKLFKADVIEMVRRGDNNKTIADAYGVKENSVSNYLSRNGIRREEVKK